MRQTNKYIAQICLFLFCLLCCFMKSFGQTNVPPGSVSGIWTKGKSPYLVNGNIVIATNQKLTIEPGVEIRFSGSYSLSVQGCLNASGVEGDSIRFTVTDKSGFATNTHLGWRGIRFQNVVHQDSSAIVYCILEYGKANGISDESSGGAIFTKGFGRIKVRNTALRNNRSTYGGAIAASGVGSLQLKDLVLQGNYATEQGGGIYSLTSELSLVRCRLINNTATYGGGGIYARTSSTVNILKSVIIGNKGGAIEAFWSCKVNIDKSTVAGNTGAPDGFDLYLSNLTCRNSILWNKTSNNTYSEINAVDQSTIRLDYCIVKSTIESGWKVANTSTKDPMFIDLAKFNANLGWTNYPTKDATKSGAIDAGNPTSPQDPDGTIADIGALPFTQTSTAFPTVSFAADTTQGLVPLPINFSNYTTQAQGEVVSWNWNFGDNTTSAEKDPIHQYTKAGIYNVKLVATNQAGKKDSLTLTKYIRALAGTIVNTSTVEGTWTKQNSPYNIYNTLTVPAGKRLIIEPGVQVFFFGQHKLIVNGSMLARGTVADSILFDRFDDKSSWHSIRIENVAASSDSTIFEYCRIAHTNYLSGDVTANGGNAVLVKNFDKVRVSHCLIRNNNGGRGAGVYAEKANIKINDNVIRNNSVAQYGAGIYVESGAPLIKGNLIEKNYGGDAAGGIWLSASKSRVEDNIISYNSCYWSGAGIVVTNTSNCILLRNLISYNESGHDDGGGLSISGSSPKVINNTIAFNKAEDGEGVLISGSSHPDFINTLIYNNRDRYLDVNANDEVYIETSNALPNFYNCNIQAGVSGIGLHAGVYKGIAKNTIDASPLYKNAAANDLSPSWANYPLADNSKSPCIDAGTIDSPHDPDGSTVDIGMRYFHQTLGNFSPRADFQADTLLGFNTLVVKFSDLSDKGNSKITEWHWAFGDGGTSTEQNPTYVYKTEGRFDVTLTIKDEKGFDRAITKRQYIRMIAGVYVKGNVNGIFDAPRYIVGGNLFVESKKILEVKSGVEFMFLGAYKLEVQGALKAKGTALKPIVFTSYDTTGLDLAHATIGYSQKPVGWAGIYVYASGVKDSTVIDHCRVQFVENNGLGAIYAFASNGAAGMRISNTEISYNSTQGIAVFSSNIIIRNNFIHHNYARTYQKGAGIYFYAGSPKIINNIITNNETADAGGGLCIERNSQPSLIGNVIMYNKASRAGGICDYSGNIELINNTIAFNASTSSTGGGYYILYAGQVKFTNNIITNNTPAQIEVADGYTKVGFRNCILEGGSAAIKGYSNSVFLYENIVTDDPKLVSGKNGNGRLLPGSPAANRGTNTGIISLLPSFDVVGNTRIINSQIDIGAYEYVSEPPLSVINPIIDMSKEEDFDSFTISLESVFEYKYGAKFLSYSIDNTSPTNLLNVSIRDRSLYFTPISDKFGNQTVKVIASNGFSQITSSIAVHITPVDDTPQFTIEGDMFVAEDFTGSKSYKIALSIPFGEENQQRSFKLEPSTVDFANIQFNAAGTLSFSAKSNLFGSQRFKLTLSEESLTHSEIFTFGVQSVNDSPTITVDNSPITIKEGEEKILPVVVSDADGDAITLNSKATNDFISLNNKILGINQYNIVITGRTAASSGVLLSASDGQLVSNITIPVTILLVTGLEEEPVTVETYPNPSVDFIVVKAKSKGSIVMMNSSGQVILQEKMGSTDVTISVGHLTSGLYLLRVNDGSKSHVLKVMKQ
jgi:parallel beta-helix repeat protein/predicted outer membrane repeat protein